MRCLVWLVFVVGCSEVSPLPAGTESFGVGRARWSGWIELVPAIQTPTFADGRDRTQVFVRFTPGGVITLADPADRTSLRMPVGAEADRVESWRVDGREIVADVRGTEFLADGERFHVARPMSLDDPRLFGTRWWRGTSETEPGPMRAALAAGLGIVGRGEVERMRERFIRLTACAGCHHAGQAERTGPPEAWPRRRTDASGLYSILATLADASILETYRPHDPNGPWATLSSPPDGPARRQLDLTSALAAHDPHAEAVCRSRRALAPFLADSVRLAFATELARCERACNEHAPRSE